MDEDRLSAPLEEATVDCYDEEEEFTGILCTLAERLNFPLHARVLEESVEVTGLNEGRSSLRRSIIPRVRKDDCEYLFALAELEFVNPDPISAEQLEVCQY